jgi:hypothetical protein
MSEHVITLTEEQEKAGLALLGSEEAVTKELQTICNYTAEPWVKKYEADVAQSTASEAVELKAKYEKLAKEDKDTVDAIFAKVSVAEVGLG